MAGPNAAVVPLPDGATVVVVGDEDDRAAAAISGAGGEPIELADGTGDSQAIVAVGEVAVRSAVRSTPGVPVLPVGAAWGFRPVPASSLESAITELFAGGWETLAHPVVDVTGADDQRRAVADVSLVAAEPGRISEFGVPSVTGRRDRVRADGVVAALPAGSPGYARAAGGPLVVPSATVVAVVPIAPYAVDPDHWVIPVAELALSVERDEVPVELVVDEDVVGRVAPGEPITASPAGTAHTVVVPSSRPFAAGLETP